MTNGVGRRGFLARSAQAGVAAALWPRMMAASMWAGHAPASGEAKGSRKKSGGAEAWVSALEGRPAPAVGTGPVRLNVREMGATGDGVTKDTAAVQAALDRCAALGGGEVLVPAGTYVIAPIQMRSNTRLRLAEGAVLQGSPDLAEYPVTTTRWEGKWIPGHIGLVYAMDATGVGVSGPGKIMGVDALGGAPRSASPLRKPALMEFVRCHGVHLEHFETHYHGMWSVHPVSSENILIEGLTIRSTGGNGDGIDVDSCRGVRIRGCDISTGDDCISLKSGRGEEGYTQAQPTEEVLIQDCTFADSIFACVGIGSETSGGIRKVRVERCRFTQTGPRTCAFYIKTRPGRGAFLEDIAAEDLDIGPGTQGFLRFNLSGSGLQDEFPVPGLEGVPTCRNFSFRNIRVDHVPLLVDGSASNAEKPLDGLLLENITGTCAKGISLSNARNVVLRDIKVTGFAGPLLSIANVTGSGLAGAAKLENVPAAKPVESKGAYTLK